MISATEAAARERQHSTSNPASTESRAIREERALDTLAEALATRYESVAAIDMLGAMIADRFPGKVALVSSFGTESVVLLHMVGRIDRGIPVLFLNTGKLFDETLRYRDRLVGRFGLGDVREIRPDSTDLADRDGDGSLWRKDPDLCCGIRKVAPLERALAPFDAWITGRKRMHGNGRENLAIVEAAGGRIKINPLARWSRSDVDAYVAAHGLERHPLEAEGFTSIGCVTCTDRTRAGEDPRAGRWRGSAKTECGIHLPTGGFGSVKDET